MINARQFGLYLDLVHRSGVHEDIEARLRPEGKGGRPRALKVDVLLAAMMATVGDHRALWLTQVHTTLTRELSRTVQREHGLRVNGQPISIRQVRYLVSAIAEAYDDSEKTRPDLDPEERAERSYLLDDIVNRMIATTSDHLEPTHRYAVDATSVSSFAKGKKRGAKGKRSARKRARRARVVLPSKSADRDADYGHRTATYGDRSKTFFGYHLTSFVRVDKDGADRMSQPMLTERIFLTAANVNDVPETVRALDRISEQVGPVLEVLADRGYSNKKTGNWAKPLRERGIEQVIDMMPSDHGGRVNKEHGYVMIDGWPHDPSTPQHLRRIERPPTFSVKPPKHDASRADKLEAERRQRQLDTFNQLIAERRLYAYDRIAFGKNGAVRFRCPGASGKLRTDGCRHSVVLPLEVPASAHPEGIAVPTACKQATIQIRADVQEKLRQRHYWGSPEWQRSYARRGTIERSFGNMKGSQAKPLERGWTRLIGRTKTLLMVAVCVAVGNIKRLMSWSAEVGDRRDPLTRLDVSDYGFEEYDVDGLLPTGVPPPAA